MNVSEIYVKELFTKSKLPDADYVCNPYIGCPHKCIYCYAEFMKRFTKHKEAWGDFVDVKRVINMKTPKFKNDQTILLSSVTDPYNPFEKKYEVTREILKELTKTSAHIEIITKSDLVIRDIDLIKRIPDISIGISMNSLNDNFRKDTEPAASSIEKRINTIRILKEYEIPTFLFVSPIFPGITDCKALINATRSYVDYFCFENLNLRGSYKERVLKYIENSYKELLPLYHQIFIEKDNTYWNKLKTEIETFCESLNIGCRMYFYHDKIKK